PVGQPLGNAVQHIAGVTEDVHVAAWTGKRGQTLDDRHELHAVVGGVALPAIKLLLHALVAQQHAPAALAGIPLAGAVGIHLDSIAQANCPKNLKNGDYFIVPGIFPALLPTLRAPATSPTGRTITGVGIRGQRGTIGVTGMTCLQATMK